MLALLVTSAMRPYVYGEKHSCVLKFVLWRFSSLIYLLHDNVALLSHVEWHSRLIGAVLGNTSHNNTGRVGKSEEVLVRRHAQHSISALMHVNGAFLLQERIVSLFRRKSPPYQQHGGTR